LETQGSSVGVIKRFLTLRQVAQIVISLSSRVKKCSNNCLERYIAWTICAFIGQHSGADFGLGVSQREAKGLYSMWMERLLAKP
jgi:hypothetical protein